jgi:hypothetical protein
MNDIERIQKHHGGPHLDGNSPQRPYWKRMHHTPFLLAMGIFVMTDGFFLRARNSPQSPVGTAAGPASAN